MSYFNSYTNIYRSFINKQVKAYLFILVFTLLSGAIRKWIIINPASGNIIFLLQLLVFFVFVLIDGNGSWKVVRNGAISVYIILLLVEWINPLNLTFFHGALGFVLHFGLWFSAFYYIANRDKFDLRPLMPIIILFCISEIVLAFIQYQLPADNFINRYADEKQVGGNYAYVGQAVRVTGTFSYISGFSAYLLFHMYFVWALVKMQYKPSVTLSLLFFGLIAAFMNGSRGATYVYVIVMGYMLFAEIRGLNLFLYIKRLIIPVVLVVLVFLARGQLGLESNVSTAFDNFDERRESGIESGEETNRIFGPFREVYNFKGRFPVMGVGIGSTYQGAQAMFGTSPYVLEYGFIENELTRIVLEGGFLLLISRLLLAFYFSQFLSFKKLTKYFIFILFFVTPTIFNVYNAVFTFLGIAILDNVYYHIEKEKLLKSP